MLAPKKLKVGKTFTDGERTFRVVEVNEDGTYRAELVEREDAPVVPFSNNP